MKPLRLVTVLDDESVLVTITLLFINLRACLIVDFTSCDHSACNETAPPLPTYSPLANGAARSINRRPRVSEWPPVNMKSKCSSPEDTEKQQKQEDQVHTSWLERIIRYICSCTADYYIWPRMVSLAARRKLSFLLCKTRHTPINCEVHDQL
jgi:hypothetical protein